MAVSLYDKGIQAREHLQKTRSNTLLLTIFLVTVLLPASLEVAGLRLSPNRLFLLIFTIPFAIKVVQGDAGRFSLVDLFLVFSGVWILLALIVSHGVERIPFAGITVVELVGGYFVGRILVQSKNDYIRVIRFMLVALICLLPFALIESATGKMIIPETLGAIFDTPSRGPSAYGRLGLERVYSVFYHPILFGLFCSIALANIFFLFSGRPLLTTVTAGFVLFMSFLALSSAPLLACAIQIGLLIWGRVTRGRWKLLVIITVVGYIGIDLASNRTPIIILIETLTFNSNTGWIRIAINKYGWASVWSNPIFGIGFNDWFRPDWLTSSVDNFWLVLAMRYGLVSLIFMVAALILHTLFLVRARIEDHDVRRCRDVYCIVLASTCFTLVTVHIWDTMACFVMFLIGSGAWIYNTEHSKTTVPDNEQNLGAKRLVPYTRFKKGRTNTHSRFEQGVGE